MTSTVAGLLEGPPVILFSTIVTSTVWLARASQEIYHTILVDKSPYLCILTPSSAIPSNCLRVSVKESSLLHQYTLNSWELTDKRTSPCISSVLSYVLYTLYVKLPASPEVIKNGNTVPGLFLLKVKVHFDPAYWAASVVTCPYESNLSLETLIYQ